MKTQENSTTKQFQSTHDMKPEIKINLNSQLKLLFGNNNNLPVNPSIDFIKNPSNTCNETNKTDVLMLVNSAVPNFHRRKAIRETFGQKIDSFKYRHKLVFLLGLSDDQRVMQKINAEMIAHDDLLLGTFNDTYRNLTLKGIMGLRWTKQFCPEVDFVVKVDDDIFVNLVQLQTFLSDEFFSSNSSTGSVSTGSGNTGSGSIGSESTGSGGGRIGHRIACSVQTNGSSAIHRGNDTKWPVDKSLFVGWSHYPFDFCNGYFVVMSGGLIRELSAAVRVTPVFWIDDVYLFGMLPASVNDVTFVNIDTRITHWYSKAKSCFRNVKKSKCEYIAVQAGHREPAEVRDYYKFWEKI